MKIKAHVIRLKFPIGLMLKMKPLFTVIIFVVIT